MRQSVRIPVVAALASMLATVGAAAVATPPVTDVPRQVPTSAGTTVTTTARTPAIDTFHPVVREPARHTRGYAADYTVYRPADLDEIKGKLPVLVFGNGACRHSSNNEYLGTHMLLAAHGFLVVAVGSFDRPASDENGAPRPEVISDAITWAERAGQRRGSALWHRVDTGRVAVAGHSCGGIEALVAGADPRVRSVLSLNSGFFADGTLGYGRDRLQDLHTPTLFLDGGPDDVAYENSAANHNLVTVPSVRASQPQAGHVGFWRGLRDGEPDATMREDAVTVLVQWLDFTLNGNPVAGRYFLSEDCGLCDGNWTVSARNF